MRFNTKFRLKTALAVLFAGAFLSCSDLGADLSDSANSDAAEYYAYLINGFSNNSVSSFTLDHPTGGLTPLEVINTDPDSPTEIAAHPSGKFVYFLHFSDKIDFYSVDSKGLLTIKGSTTSELASNNNTSIIIHPSGKFAYVLKNNTIIVYSIAETGELTLSGTHVSTGTHLSSIKIDPSGKYAYVVNNTDKTLAAYSINSSGMLSATGNSVATGAGPLALALHSSGKYAYVVNYADKTVSAYSINSSGNLSSIGSPAAAGASSNNITIDPSGKFVYVGNYDTTPTMFAYSISSTGDLIPQNSGNPVITATGYKSVSITFVPKSNFAYVIYSYEDVGSSGKIDKAVTYTIDSSGTLKETGKTFEVGKWALSMIVVRK